LLCKRRINKLPFLDNGSLNKSATIEELLIAVFSVGSAPTLYKEDPKAVELLIERELRSGTAVEVGK
jgi:hypothetical protein